MAAEMTTYAFVAERPSAAMLLRHCVIVDLGNHARADEPATPERVLPRSSSRDEFNMSILLRHPWHITAVAAWSGMDF